MSFADTLSLVFILFAIVLAVCAIIALLPLDAERDAEAERQTLTVHMREDEWEETGNDR
jgi:hypothetical protein